ncbi:hypothetical protein SAMN05216389_10142 [Oceanobacillus limi]|uniref:Uncharacterized protein n=2 Tax=Oceanobacillus limi TaxID=930131 RepID=A0A1H9Y0T2_9BACI|nr:hypothetical protein SAMN05216389_10142 [Oceanobacillus limi]
MTMKRFVTALLATVVFAAIFSGFSYVPTSQREPNVYYFGFFETMVFVIIYASPVYFLVGLPSSILIDKIVIKVYGKSKWNRYFWRLGFYSLAGILISVILLVFIQNNDLLEAIPFTICCMIASNIYFHLYLLVSKVMKKNTLVW